MPSRTTLELAYAICPESSVQATQPPPPTSARPSSHDPTDECLSRSEWNKSYKVTVESTALIYLYTWFLISYHHATFGTISVKSIWSTSNVTNVYGSGTDGSKFGSCTCWWRTHTANISMSSINRPKRTLPRNVTYLSRMERSVLSGIMAEVNESCIERCGNSSTDFGWYWVKYSRLFGSTDQCSWSPSFFDISAFTEYSLKYEIKTSNYTCHFTAHYINIYRHSLFLHLQNSLPW